MMKKLFLAAILIGGTFFANAQETKFGVRAGVNIATVKASYTNPVTGSTTTVSGSETGFFAGGFAHIGLTESFAFQPELLYISINSSGVLSVPVLGKYSFGKFSVLAGPDLNYFLDAEEDEFKVNIDAGASYDITENFEVQARYSAGLGDVSMSGIFLSAGYKF